MNEINQTTPERKLYAFRYLARIVLQAETPLSIGSGESNIQTDSPVIRDINGLPFIPGTSLAGILRHAVDSLEQKKSTPFSASSQKKAPTPDLVPVYYVPLHE